MRLEGQTWVNIEILNHFSSDILHTVIYLLLHISLKLLEGLLNFLISTALLVYFPNATFNIDIVCTSKHLVACSKNIIEELKLSG